jgi:hypothetical protein
MPSSELVALKGGLTVPAEPLLLVFELEGRGFSLRADAAGRLAVSPALGLTAEDRARIQRWKFHLLELIDYQAPEV